VAIMSNVFGRVTLTDEDAKKFRRQTTYGRPKSEAAESLRKGLEISRELRDSGRVSVKVTIQPKQVAKRQRSKSRA